jgi:hypothetical protein
LEDIYIYIYIYIHIRGPFGKFVDSPYYSESEVYGGAVTVSFEVPPLASDALLTTLHPLLENVLQIVCRKLQEDSGTGGFDFSAFVYPSLKRFHQLKTTARLIASSP